MKTLLRAIISGFGFSLGAAVFRKISRELGLDDGTDKKAVETPPAPPTENGDDGEVARA
jgi:hypothetical protein